ncbi:MAG TPA: low temperature requirement protein A [Thermoleophilaceae bacterium]|nr:low temperature requirement protein A [Thermoleophilaceae bacterium]
MAADPTLVDAAEAAEGSEHASDAEQRVGPLELFFDLVFVFAITQVTQFIAEDPTWEGLARGLMILAVVWWAWVAYSWLTNTLDTEKDHVRLVMFVAMGAMFVVSLSIPNAFNDDALLFALAYLVVRAAHILLYGFASNDTGVQQAVKRLAPSMVVAAALLVVASFLAGPPQGLLWLAAIAIDYAGPVLGGMGGWTLQPGHFAERHGLIVIIAFGESIVATGLGAAGIVLDLQVVLAAMFGIVLAAALWWLYFDVVALVAERHLHEAKGLAQVRMARDSYSYIHVLMIAGIVLMALGAKKTIGEVDEPLKVVPAVALCGGVTLYLVGHIAFRLRNIGTLNRQRLVVAAVAAGLIPVAVEVDALLTLGVLAALCASLIAYEAIHFRDARQRVRAAR